MRVRTGSLAAVMLLAACGSSLSAGDGSGGSTAAGAGTGGGAGRGGVGGNAGMVSNCPPGVGAWKSTNPDPLTEGKAQYDRCMVLCEATQAAACPSFVMERCQVRCNDYENQAVNGWCTEPLGVLISCFETLNDPCQNPQHFVQGSCDQEKEDVDCCLERWCNDPVNVGRCG